jgi:hypothetical protein
MFILVICLAGVFCLAPLSVYLLWLAVITRRERPTVVSGQWDFAGLVLGLSGFILFGGGLVLSLFQSNVRYWMRGNFESLRAAWGQEKVTWIVLVLLYLLCVVGWIGLTIAARRRSLVVYNVDPAAFEATLTEVFEQLNRPVERRGDLWVGGEPLFELDRFVAGRTVTLRWIAEDRLLFQEVERLVREAVRAITTDDNPSTRWLMSGSAAAGLSAVLCFGLLVYALSLFR